MSLANLARWCHQRRRLVVVAWAVAFVVLNIVGAAVGNGYTDNFSGGHSASISAFALLKERSPARAGDTADIVLATSGGVRVEDGRVRQAVEQLLDRIGPGKVAHVT